MAKINGEIVKIDNVSILDYLKENGYNPLMVAVEINEEIVPKTTFDSHLIKDEDTVEIVSFVGGGWLKALV